MGNITDVTTGLEQWLPDAVQQSIQLGGGGLEAFEHLISAGHDRPHIIPPERLAYLRKLKTALLNGRVITSYYNHVLLGLLAFFTLLHLLEKRRYQRQRQTRASTAVGGGNVGDRTGTHDASTGSTCSTSSSPCILTPSGAIKDVEIDIERLPLLGFRRTHLHSVSPPGFLTRVQARLIAWSEYQPEPLPLVNRVLPSNAVSFFVLLWFCINLCFHFYQLPLGLEYTKVFAARAGDIFIVNLPLLYLLAAKNQPIKLLTGRSYEALNIFHRRVGEWMCFEAFIHSAGEVLWRFACAPDWLSIRPDLWQYLTHPIIYYGVGAFVSYELLYFSSLGSFRRRWYELFLASHVGFQVAALGFLYLHYHTARPYIKVCLLIFLADRLVWRLGMKSTIVDSDLQVLPDGETIVLSAVWETTVRASRWSLWPRQSVRFGWDPTDHVFLSVPTLGKGHSLQAHPFTISSAAPHRETGRMNDDPRQPKPISPASSMKLSLLIRAQTGFTVDLLCYALRHRKVSVRLDGPYGSSHALEMLRAADNAVLVAGGSGIAVCLPLIWALLRDELRRRPGRHGTGVRLLWVIHCEEHRHWVSKREMDELVAAGLEVVIPEPTAIAGRPDVAGQVDEWIAEGGYHDRGGGSIAVVVSGPDGLNRTVRNTCAVAIGRGSDVQLAVEKFGW